MNTNRIIFKTYLVTMLCAVFASAQSNLATPGTEELLSHADQPTGEMDETAVNKAVLEGSSFAKQFRIAATVARLLADQRNAISISSEDKNRMTITVSKNALFIDSTMFAKWDEPLLWEEQKKFAEEELDISPDSFKVREENGLGLIAWFLKYFKEPNISIQKVNDETNRIDPHNLKLQSLNDIGLLIADWAKCRIALRKINDQREGALSLRLVQHYRHQAEIPYRTGLYAAYGITTFLVKEPSHAQSLAFLGISVDSLFGNDYADTEETIEEIKTILKEIWHKGKITIPVLTADNPLLKKYARQFTQKQLRSDCKSYAEQLKRMPATAHAIRLIRHWPERFYVQVTGRNHPHIVHTVMGKIGIASRCRFLPGLLSRIPWIKSLLRRWPWKPKECNSYLYDPVHKEHTPYNFSENPLTWILNDPDAAEEALKHADSHKFTETMNRQPAGSMVGIKRSEEAPEIPIENVRKLLMTHHIDGIEIYMPKHSSPQISMLKQMIKELNTEHPWYQTHRINSLAGTDGRSLRSTSLVHGKIQSRGAETNPIIRLAERRRAEFIDHPNYKSANKLQLILALDAHTAIEEKLIAAYILLDMPRITESDEEDVNIRLRALEIIRDAIVANPQYFPRSNKLKNMEDLHYKSYRSDGANTPAFIVFNAWLKGAKSVGVVDNHTFSSHLEAIRAREILETVAPINVKTGVEYDFREEKLGILFGHIIIFFPHSDGSAAYRHMLDTIKQDPFYKNMRQDDRRLWHLQRIKRLVIKFNNKFPQFRFDQNDLTLLPEYPNWHSLGYWLFQKYGSKRLGAADYHEAAIMYFRHPDFIKDPELDPDTIAREHGALHFSLELPDLLTFAERCQASTMLPHPIDPRFEDQRIQNLLFEVGGNKSLGVADYYAEPEMLETMLEHMVVGRIELQNDRISDRALRGIHDVEIGNGKVLVVETNRVMLPAAEVMGYRSLLKKTAEHAVILNINTDTEQVVLMQIESSMNQERLDRLHIPYMPLDKKRILAVYTHKQSSLMVQEFKSNGNESADSIKTTESLIILGAIAADVRAKRISLSQHLENIIIASRFVQDTPDAEKPPQPSPHQHESMTSP